MTSDIVRLAGSGGGQATRWPAHSYILKWPAVMCSLWMRPLADADPQNFCNLRTDVDNILSVFLSRILSLITAKRH